MKSWPYFFGLACLVYGCNAANETKHVKNGPITEHRSLEPFADSMVRLDQYALTTITAVASYFQKLVPADTALADSAAVIVLRQAWTVVDTVNQKLFHDTADYFDLVYNNSSTAPEKQKQFQQNLEAHHIKLQGDGEGSVYAVLDYSWLIPLLQQKTSVAVDHYLLLLSKEEKSPTLLDAGLAIEMNELVDRLIASEHLIGQTLPKNFADDVLRKNRFYTGVLINGSDNSPSLDYHTLQVSEAFQKGYAYLLANYPATKAAQLVKKWQAILRQKNQKKIAEWQNLYTPY